MSENLTTIYNYNKIARPFTIIIITTLKLLNHF